MTDEQDWVMLEYKYNDISDKSFLLITSFFLKVGGKLGKLEETH